MKVSPAFDCSPYGLACSDCRVALPAGRKLRKCNRCQKEQIRQWRAGMTLSTTTEFPGVDIDAIHYKLGALAVKEGA